MRCMFISHWNFEATFVAKGNLSCNSSAYDITARSLLGPAEHPIPPPTTAVLSGLSDNKCNSKVTINALLCSFLNNDRAKDLNLYVRKLIFFFQFPFSIFVNTFPLLCKSFSGIEFLCSLVRLFFHRLLRQ